jgi:hypothetical protein
MFDISARPYVSADELTFAAPMNKFERMIDNMEESFLITESWKIVQKRIGQRSPCIGQNQIIKNILTE